MTEMKKTLFTTLLMCFVSLKSMPCSCSFASSNCYVACSCYYTASWWGGADINGCCTPPSGGAVIQYCQTCGFVDPWMMALYVYSNCETTNYWSSQDAADECRNRGSLQCNPI